jgi:Carboxypeptidase regulatory-like domain
VRSRSRLFGRALVAGASFFAGVAAVAAATGSGSIRGRVSGPDGQLMAGVGIELRNDITGFKADTTTGSDGNFAFFNVPFNPYHVEVEAKGFKAVHRTADVRSSMPLVVNVTLELASITESVTVSAEGQAAQLETDSSTSHVDVDKSYIARMPATVSSRAMEELVTATPGFAKDENGRYHFQGAHSQGQFVIDGQTISDQTGVTFSNSIDPGIAQSMEVIYGNVPAEYGEKIGSVVNLVTRSGLGTPFHGDVYGGGARYSTYEGGLALGGGSRNFGSFLSLNGSRSERFLDPVNFDNLHNTGDTERGFVRLDYASDDLRDQLRLTALVGRTSRDVPNTFSQQESGQAQTVESRDQNYNLGWTHVFSGQASLDANAFTRTSTFKLLPSAGDTPVTGTSDRSLDNYGLNASIVWAPDRRHTIKVGGTVKRFPIEERFTFGITDPTFNDPDSEEYNPDLAPYDLTRGGSPLAFHDQRTGTYAAAFVQDDFRLGGLTANLGLRYDHNDLPTTEDALEPRVGLAYYVEGSHTVLRASYNRVLYTPEYENILFSSSELAASVVPPEIKDSRELGGGVLLVRSERQNAYTVGVQQAVGRRVRLDVDFWWRRSKDSGDQDQFENTGIVFPIAFDSGRFNGWDARVDLAQTHGLRGFLSLGHTHAIYIPPPVGGLFLDAEALDAITGGPFLIDHDQKLQLQGQLLWDVAQTGFWLGAGLRYDSGLVTDASPDELLQDPDNSFAAPYVVVHSGGDLDPNRIEARTIANFSVGWDLGKRRVPVAVQLDLLNAFDTQGLYNILSVFSGTHVIPPRTLSLRVRYSFGGNRG